MFAVSCSVLAVRPLRMEVAGAWYQVTNRGHRGGALFLDEADRRRSQGAVAELPERLALEVHALVPKPNHDHALVRTQEANPTQATRWLKVSDVIAFNWAHRCHGAAFRGRFKRVLIREEGEAGEVMRGEPWARWAEQHGDWNGTE